MDRSAARDAAGSLATGLISKSMTSKVETFTNYLFENIRTSNSVVPRAMLSTVSAHRDSPKAVLRLSAVLFALSDLTRLHIVRTLASQGETMCAAVGVSLAKSSCSRHFKVLREAGVIRCRRRGTAYLNSLCRDELDATFPGLIDAVLHAAADLSTDAWDDKSPQASLQR